MTSAAASSDFLFIPSQYTPRSNQLTVTWSRGSWQKQAAREHHRKVRKARTDVWYANAASRSRPQSAIPPAASTTREPSPHESAEQDPPEPLHPPVRVISRVRDAGTGEWDPFGSAVWTNLPDYVLQMLVHGITHQWTVSVPADSSAQTNNIKHAVLANCKSSKAAFYTTVFAGATHYAFARAGRRPSRRNKILRYEYKTRAITELNKEIQALKGPASEELLMCIITLAAHGDGENLEPPSLEMLASASPLSIAQDFLYYTRMNFETAHLSAVEKLVDARGGLQTIKTPGLANAIALMDIYIALVHMRPPTFALLVPTETVLSYWSEVHAWKDDLQLLGRGFDNLPASVRTTALTRALENIRQTVLGYDMYLNEQRGSPSLFLIVWARSSIQHDLLSIDSTLPSDVYCRHKPKGSSCHSCVLQHDLNRNLYSIVRLATMAFVLHLLFPMPRSAGIHTEVAARLMQVLDTCCANRMSQAYFDVLQWATVIGGATANESQRPLFVERLIRNAAIQDLSREQQKKWRQEVESICSEYLWYPLYDLAKEAEAFWQYVWDAADTPAQ